MRRFLRAVNAVKAAAVVFLSLACAAMLLLLLLSPAFAQGESYELYYGNSSSGLIVRTENPLAAKLAGGVVGESVQYEGDCREELIEQYAAELLFTEQAGDVTNYYLYSPYLGSGIAIGGYVVNLHIAVGGGRTAVGTPVIFGGY